MTGLLAERTRVIKLGSVRDHISSSSLGSDNDHTEPTGASGSGSREAVGRSSRSGSGDGIDTLISGGSGSSVGGTGGRVMDLAAVPVLLRHPVQAAAEGARVLRGCTQARRLHGRFLRHGAVVTPTLGRRRERPFPSHHYSRRT